MTIIAIESVLLDSDGSSIHHTLQKLTYQSERHVSKPLYGRCQFMSDYSIVKEPGPLSLMCSASLYFPLNFCKWTLFKQPISSLQNSPEVRLTLFMSTTGYAPDGGKIQLQKMSNWRIKFNKNTHTSPSSFSVNRKPALSAKEKRLSHTDALVLRRFNMAETSSAVELSFNTNLWVLLWWLSPWVQTCLCMHKETQLDDAPYLFWVIEEHPLDQQWKCLQLKYVMISIESSFIVVNSLQMKGWSTWVLVVGLHKYEPLPLLVHSEALLLDSEIHPPHVSHLFNS